MSFIATFFTALGVFLQAYNIYINSSRQEKDKVKALREMGPLFEQLKFCKVVHNTFQEFGEGRLDQFIARTKNLRDFDVIEPEWKTIKSFYQKKIENSILPCVPSTIPKNENIKVEEYPFSIRDEVRLLSKQSLGFLRHLKSCNIIYQELRERLKRLDLGNFSELKTNLEDLVTQIIEEADTMILNLIPILLFMYDQVFSGSK